MSETVVDQVQYQISSIHKAPLSKFALQELKFEQHIMVQRNRAIITSMVYVQISNRACFRQPKWYDK